MNRYVPIPSKYNSISIPILCIQPTDLKQSSMYLLSVGEFKYDEDDNMEGLVTKPPIELENGVIYIGRWNSKGKRRNSILLFY